MDKTGHIEIIVRGRKGNLPLTPELYDIREVMEVLQQVEALLYPGSKKKDRPIISYGIEESSVKHVLKTALQVVIGFNALLGEIQAHGNSLDFLELPTARAFEFFQNTARKNNFEIEVKTSIDKSSVLIIDPKTKFIRSEEVWVDAEFYFYGTIVDAGGKGKANVHLDTKDYGLLTIASEKELLSNHHSNPLYKSYGVRAIGKQNMRTGEVDKETLRLLEIVNYNPAYDESYIQSLIQKAKKSWSDVPDADEWLENIRGYGD